MGNTLFTFCSWNKHYGHPQVLGPFQDLGIQP